MSKGRTVILLSDHYSELCAAHLEDPAYELVKFFGTGRKRVHLTDLRTDRDIPFLNANYKESDLCDCLLKYQCSRLRDLLSTLFAAHQISALDLHKLSPSHPYSGVILRFYALPKLHKIGPLRIHPIISNFLIYCDGAMIHLKSILNLLPNGFTSVLHSYELAELLDSFEFTPTD